MGHTIQFLNLGTRLSIAQKVNGQGHQAALLSAALTREAGAAVTVMTYWAWETTATPLQPPDAPTRR